MMTYGLILTSGAMVSAAKSSGNDDMIALLISDTDRLKISLFVGWWVSIRQLVTPRVFALHLIESSHGAILDLLSLGIYGVRRFVAMFRCFFFRART